MNKEGKNIGRKVNIQEKKMRRAVRNTDERDKCKGITIDFLHIG